MKNSRLGIVFVSLVALVLLFTYIGHARKSNAQDPEKSLDIERYPNEPLEIVDLRIGQNAVKNGVRFKSKENISKWGLDNVKFKEKNGWFRHLKIRLRNVSGRPIYGLRAGLHFLPSDMTMSFSLPLTWTRDLERQPLQPNDEIDLEVSEQLFTRAMQRIRAYGADPDLLGVSFSLDDAMFGDDLMWSRGVLLRRDPKDRNKWDAVDTRNLPEPAS